MNNSQQHTNDSTDKTQQRQRNRMVVEDYLSRKGEGRLTRYQLFAEDGCSGLWTNDTLEPIVSSGHDLLKKHAVWSLQCFPDWEWRNVQTFETQDPDYFIVECDGSGKILFPGYAPGHYSNHFFHTFRLEDGLIKEQREFMNPYRQMLALDMPITRIRREGIPKD